MGNPITSKRYSTYTTIAIASSGGLLLGFNSGIISGILPLVKQCWYDLSYPKMEWVTLAILVGSILGALATGYMLNKYGRKNFMIVSSILYAFGNVLSGASPNLVFLIFSLFIVGIAIGITSTVIPVYLGEISPTSIRGNTVYSFYLMIILGIVLAHITTFFFTDELYPFLWRRMFYTGVFPTIIIFIGQLFVPESPRFLLHKGYYEKGNQILNKIEPRNLAEQIINQYKTAIKSDNKKRHYFADFFNAGNKKAFKIGIGIMVIQQLLGISAIIYYFPSMFLKTGLKLYVAEISPALIIGLVILLSAFTGMFLIEKTGRRKLFLIGMKGLIISLIALCIVFVFKLVLRSIMPWIVLLLIFNYIVFFSISLWPLSWLIISEIFPFRIRGLGVSISIIAGLFLHTMVTLATGDIPVFDFFADFGLTTQVYKFVAYPSVIFLIYSIIALVGIFWGNRYLPETGGLTLEMIEKQSSSGDMITEHNK